MTLIDGPTPDPDDPLVADNPAILDRPYVFVAFDGTVTEHPSYGWVIAQGGNQ